MLTAVAGLLPDLTGAWQWVSAVFLWAAVVIAAFGILVATGIFRVISNSRKRKPKINRANPRPTSAASWSIEVANIHKSTSVLFRLWSPMGAAIPTSTCTIRRRSHKCIAHVEAAPSVTGRQFVSVSYPDSFTPRPDASTPSKGFYLVLWRTSDNNGLLRMTVVRVTETGDAFKIREGPSRSVRRVRQWYDANNQDPN
jgi:hypothetical protein